MLERNAVKAARFVPRGLPGEQSPGGYSTQEFHNYYNLIRHSQNQLACLDFSKIF
jgi:hypothetical protein